MAHVTYSAKSGARESLSRILGIAGNTFRESIRQPVILIIMAISVVMIALSPYTTFFTMLESDKMVKEMGLATILVAGLLISAAAASSVVSREIENRTVLTIISKPVGRVEFILGKYLGVLACLFLASYVIGQVLILTSAVGGFEAGPLQDVHFPILLSMVGMGLAVLIAAAILNFKKNYHFAATAVMLAAPGFTLVTIVFMVLQVIFAMYWPEGLNIVIDVWVIVGGFLVMLALFIIAAIAVAVSTRLSAVATILICASIFMLGLLSDYLFYEQTAENIFARVAYSVIPNFQVFWLADAIVAGRWVPLTYIGSSLLYSMCYIIATLFVAMLLFEDRQVS